MPCTGDATKPTLFKLMPRFIYSNSGIGLPRRDSICTVLGISNSTAFAVRIVIICDRTSTQTGYVCGRNQFVKNSSGGNAMDSNYYPYRMGNNADTDMGKWNMANGRYSRVPFSLGRKQRLLRILAQHKGIT